jgi:hypothetical protein
VCARERERERAVCIVIRRNKSAGHAGASEQVLERCHCSFEPQLSAQHTSTLGIKAHIKGRQGYRVAETFRPA